VTSLNGTTYEYDKNGNLKTDQTWNYVWDYNNRMTQATSSSDTIDYEYDHTGQRTVYSDGTTTTVYANIYYNTDGTNKTKHIYAGNLLVATVEYDGATTTTHYIHTDHLTGSNVVTDEDGNLEQLMDYYPFGDQRINSQETTFDEQRKFTGHEHDSDTDLEYMKARYYNGDIGRFTGQDAAFLAVGDNQQLKAITGLKLQKYLENPQAFNSYSYAVNNPLVVVDANGEWIEYIIGQQNAVSLGNWGNNLYNNNSVARYAMDHPGQTGAVVGILGGAAVAGGVIAGGGSITCGILCGSGAVTITTGGTALSTQGDKAVRLLSNTNKMLSGGQRQAISGTIQNGKLQNMFNSLYQASDKLPGGTAGAIRFERATGELMSKSGHLYKGQTTINGLNNLMQNANLSQGDQAIAQTLVKQLSSAIK